MNVRDACARARITFLAFFSLCKLDVLLQSPFGDWHSCSGRLRDPEIPEPEELRNTMPTENWIETMTLSAGEDALENEVDLTLCINDCLQSFLVRHSIHLLAIHK